MMESPEIYYEYNLKGKDEKQIMNEIDRLKNTIEKLKKTMEQPDYVCLIRPSDDVRLRCTRLYLETAKEALAEAGGIYMPDAWKVKAADFDENIPYICKMEFIIGGYFGGYDILIYTIDGDNVYRSFQHSYSTHYVDNEIGNVINMDTADFLCEFAKLHIGEWNSVYYDNNICDGTQWNLDIYYSNGCEPVKFFGSNEYPYNFNKLLKLFECKHRTH